MLYFISFCPNSLNLARLATQALYTKAHKKSVDKHLNPRDKCFTDMQAFIPRIQETC